jgi:hypothetical protein
MHKILVAATAALAVTAAQAQEVKLGTVVGQNAFRALSEDLGSALSYKPNISTEPLAGLIPVGFDVGLSVSSTKLAKSSQYAQALEGDSNFILPTVRAHVGIPFGIDVGVAYASVPGSNVKYTGGEIRYALMKGGIALPAVGIRGSMSKVSGVDGLDFSTKGMDLSISKGILMLTPYAGLGKVWVKSSATSFGFSEEDFTQNKVFAGVGFKMLLLNLNLEADKTGDAKSYSAKVGLRF